MAIEVFRNGRVLRWSNDTQAVTKHAMASRVTEMSIVRRHREGWQNLDALVLVRFADGAEACIPFDAYWQAHEWCLQRTEHNRNFAEAVIVDPEL